MFLKFIFKSI